MSIIETIEWFECDQEMPTGIDFLLRLINGDIVIGHKSDHDYLFYCSVNVTDEIYNVMFFSYLPKGPLYNPCITNDDCLKYLLSHTKGC
jgi:hypothetical protein